MADRAKIRLVGVEGSWSAAAIANELLIPVDRANRHDQGVAIGSPDAASRSHIGSTSTVRASVATVTDREQH